MTAGLSAKFARVTMFRLRVALFLLGKSRNLTLKPLVNKGRGEGISPLLAEEGRGERGGTSTTATIEMKAGRVSGHFSLLFLKGLRRDSEILILHSISYLHHVVLPT